MSNSKLTAREWLFCRYYASAGNAREAAAKSGCLIMPERAGERMLKKDRVQKELKRIRKAQNPDRSEVAAGFRRLAFGSIADPIRLLLDNGDISELETLDLYNISEIKRTAGKGVEIKFFDRLKALEHLAELAEENESTAAEGFFRSLRSEEKINDDF